MGNFLKIIVFSLLVIGFFAGFSNFGVPSIKPPPPPKEEKLDLGGMTMERFVALGAKIFAGKGNCPLCHNKVGGRAPMLETAAVIAAKRLKDPRYKGSAENAEEYLEESLTEPSAFVVVGFGKKGTADKVSPMPDVSAGSIRLSEPEIKSVVAYLQDLGGVEVTVEIPKGDGEAKEEDEDEDDDEKRVAYKTPDEIIEGFTCGACHKVGEAEGEIGPDLSKIGANRDRAHMRRSILDPNAEIAKGFEKDQMPADYGTTMYVKELEMLLDYLAKQK